MSRIKKLEDALEALKPYYRYGAEDFGYTNDASSAIAEGTIRYTRGIRP